MVLLVKLILGPYLSNDVFACFHPRKEVYISSLPIGDVRIQSLCTSITIS